MIQTIKMRDCATYNEMGAELAECSRINFIYGPNGSGKSTISNYLQDMSNPFYSKCAIDWTSGEPTEILVYNRNFKEKNIGCSDIDGVFTLGQATIEEKNALENLKNTRAKRQYELEAKKACLKSKQEEIEKLTKDFQETIWKVMLKENEGDFQEAFAGYRAKKEKFLLQVLERFKINHSSSETREDLISKSKTLFSKKPTTCDLINIDIHSLVDEINEIESDMLWKKHIIGSKDVPLSKLISYLNNSDWVNRGRLYLTDDMICPFCQQKTITAEFIQQLDSFFSGEYEKDISAIAKLKERYQYLFSCLKQAVFAIMQNNEAVTIGKLDISAIQSKIDLVASLIENNITEMTLKESEPSREVALKLSDITEIYAMIESVNTLITQHNNMVVNFNDEKSALIAEIWTFLLDENEALINGYLNDVSRNEKAVKGIKQVIKSFELEIQQLSNQIIEDEKNVTSVEPTVNEINRLLKAYGFNNFQIVASKQRANSYQIQRPDGTLATKTLSEGEETFISFLYFLQLIKGATDVSKVSAKRILVIDDPICSLDSTILYIVSTLVKDLIYDIKELKSNVEQVFILTHNVFFHKEASFVNGKVDESNDVSYWIIHKDDNISSINSYNHHNPIRTSYELLWQEFKNTPSTSFITTQNVMRRIIENYFGMLGNRKYDHIKKQFSTIEEQQICESLFYWINDGSHTIPDDLFIDSYSDSIDKYKTIFKEIFIKSGHKSHYDMMMGEEE